MKRRKFKPPWFKCGHCTELASGRRMYCELDVDHTGVHMASRGLLGIRVTWSRDEKNRRWD